MSLACRKCGSVTWTVSGSMGCDNCPSSVQEKVIMVVLATVVVALLFAAGATYGQWAYGDWTCGFKECRVVVEKP